MSATYYKCNTVSEVTKPVVKTVVPP